MEVNGESGTWRLAMLSTPLEGIPPASDPVQLGRKMGPGELFEQYRETCQSRGIDVSAIIHEPVGRLFSPVRAIDLEGGIVLVNAIGKASGRLGLAYGVHGMSSGRRVPAG